MIRSASDSTARPRITISEVTDPELIAQLNAQRAQADQNAAWLQAHATEVYSHRGKYFCVAGQELFVADTLREAVSAARAKHPDDHGYYCRYIPVEKCARI